MKKSAKFAKKIVRSIGNWLDRIDDDEKPDGVPPPDDASTAPARDIAPHDDDSDYTDLNDRVDDHRKYMYEIRRDEEKDEPNTIDLSNQDVSSEFLPDGRRRTERRVPADSETGPAPPPDPPTGRRQTQRFAPPRVPQQSPATGGHTDKKPSGKVSKPSAQTPKREALAGFKKKERGEQDSSDQNKVLQHSRHDSAYSKRNEMAEEVWQRFGKFGETISATVLTRVLASGGLPNLLKKMGGSSTLSLAGDLDALAEEVDRQGLEAFCKAAGIRYDGKKIQKEMKTAEAKALMKEGKNQQDKKENTGSVSKRRVADLKPVALSDKRDPKTPGKKLPETPDKLLAPKRIRRERPDKDIPLPPKPGSSKSKIDPETEKFPPSPDKRSPEDYLRDEIKTEGDF